MGEHMCVLRILVGLQRRKNPCRLDDSRGSKVLARLIQRLRSVCSESLDYLHVIRECMNSIHEVSAHKFLPFAGRASGHRDGKGHSLLCVIHFFSYEE